MEQGVPMELVRDWLTLRKQHKAPATKTAIAGIEREVAKARISLADALRMSCERGWRGFKAEWLEGARRPMHPEATPSIFRGAL